MIPLIKPGSAVQTNETTSNITSTNSTFSGNAVSGSGGGIYNSQATISLVNTTVAGNSAPSSGSGIRADTNGTYLLTNTIISSSGFGGDCFGLGTFTSLGHNLDSDGTCGLAATGDLSGVNPLIGPLADNGGPTLTHALQFGSPAIDAGNNALCSATDQRSAPRPAGAACDMGAYEANSIPLGVVPSVSDWALIALALLLGAGVYIRRRRSSPAPSASLIGLLPVM